MQIYLVTLTLLSLALTRETGAVNNSSYCSWRWISRNGVCFYTRDYKEYTLPAAVQRCERIRSKMLSSQADQIKSLQKSPNVANRLVWLDLYRRTEGNSPGWYWGNGQRFVPSILKWNEGVKSVYSYTLFGLSTQGTIVQRQASRLNGYICEIKAANETCPTDFKRVGSDCFFVSDLTDVTDLKSYWSSTFGCDKKVTGAKLLEIATEEKMRTVNSLISVQSSRLWWIGLTNYNNMFRWDNNGARFAPLDSYLKLANEPDNLGGEENCAAMYTRTMRLVDVPCVQFQAKAYCTKPDSISPFSPFTGKFGCGNEGWIRAGMSCYLRIEKYQSWDKARSDCQKIGGDMVDMRASIELTWMMNWLLYKKVWTGLCYTKGAWRWSDGTAADDQSLQWDTEPKMRSSLHGSCAVLNGKGEFIARPCDNVYRYICETREDDESKCPDGWVYFNRSCYFMAPSNQTNWSDARFHCRALAGKQHHGYLYFPTYINEVDFVMTTFLSKIVLSQPSDRLYVWTLLTDDNTGVWGYYFNEHKPVDTSHINWRKSPSQEATSSDGSYCAILSRGYLVDQPRNMTYRAMCKRPLGATAPTKIGKTGRLGGGQSPLAAALWLVAACVVLVTRCE